MKKNVIQNVAQCLFIQKDDFWSAEPDDVLETLHLWKRAHLPDWITTFYLNVAEEAASSWIREREILPNREGPDI